MGDTIAELNNEILDLRRELKDFQKSISGKLISSGSSNSSRGFAGMPTMNVIKCLNNYDGEIPKYSAVALDGYDVSSGLIKITRPGSSNVHSMGITQSVVDELGQVAKVMVSGVTLVKTPSTSENIEIGDYLFLIEDKFYVDHDDSLSSEGLCCKALQDSIAEEEYIYALIGASSSESDIVYWSRASQPTPTAGKFNIWKDTDNGHVAFYLDEITAWARVTGFM